MCGLHLKESYKKSNQEHLFVRRDVKGGLKCLHVELKTLRLLHRRDLHASQQYTIDIIDVPSDDTSQTWQTS
jgi:hypothetical protein